MDSSVATIMLCPPSKTVKTEHNNDTEQKHEKNNKVLVFDSSLLQNQPKIPKQFIWKPEDLVGAVQELNEPLVDLCGVLEGDEASTMHAAKLIWNACLNHGVFQVINHGVDFGLISLAYDQLDTFFKLPIIERIKFRKKPDSIWGYSTGHAERFSSNLPWKETLTLGYDYNGASKDTIVNYFTSKLGEDFDKIGMVYQRYCEEMEKLSLVIMELVAISLGVNDRMHFRRFYEDSTSTLRSNYYPKCQEPHLTLGTGPHCDPTSLTILYQDQVGGLEVFTENKWQAIRPNQDALVINIGDTLSALTNGIYKSCLHRAQVNMEKDRKSLTFFMNPNKEKVVRPPEDLLVGEEKERKYPDFTWPIFLYFTQKHYRSDDATLQSFTKWLLSSTHAA